MAFVFKSKRKTTFGENPNTELGPGQYITSDSIALKSNSNLKAPPFLTSANRKTGFVNNEETPGPGTYQLVEPLVSPNQHESVLAKKTNTLYNNLEVEDPTIIHPLGFLIKDKRFHEHVKDEVPGPGKYHNENKLTKRKIKSSVNPRIMIPLTSAREKIPSIPIPSKNKCFGFEILDDGQIKLAEDPLKFIKYEGDKLDSVGPGAYELSDKKKWQRGGTAWSKFKTKRNLIEKPEIKKQSANHSFDEINNKKVIERRKQEKDQLTKYMKEKAMIRRQLVEAFNNEQQDEIDKIIKNETPGPGYYEYGKMYSTAKEVRVPENYQFFGSVCERFRINQLIEDNIGPGSYFKGNCYSKNKKRPKSNAAFNTRSDRNITSSKDVVPGPGLYNPNKLGKKNQFATKTIFATSTKRETALVRKKEDVPGPGSYLEIKSDLKLNDARIKYKYSAPFKSTKRHLVFGKEDIPPVGSYNPDLITDILYNNGKKAYRPSMINVPFSSLKKRFEEKHKESIVGPGQYFREITENKTRDIMPFGTGDKRFRSLQKQEIVAPIGSYNLNSHFDWNKKTFNINFL